MTDQREDVLKLLTAVVGEDHASGEREILFAYARDAQSPLMGDFAPDYVVRPGCLNEVQEVVRIASQNRIPLQPMIRGTNHGAMALATEGGILIDLRRMNRILEINEVTMSATIEPGVTWRELNREARKQRLYIDVPMGPYTGSPVGSWSSWNMSIYFGAAPADKVLSLELVLPNGQILRTGSAAYPPHDSSNPYFREAYGPDLTGLFRGAFGAFGIITKMTVGLHPLFETQERVDCGFEDLGSTVRAMQSIARMNIQTFLLMYDNHLMALCCAPDFDKFENDQEEFKRILGLFPRYLISLGLNGSKEQVALYSKLIHSIIADNGGSLFDPKGLQTEVQDNMDDFLPGAGRRVSRMLAPHNTHIAILAWLPFDRVVAASREACKIVEEMGYRSELSGESTPTSQMYVWGPHGRTVMLEHDLNYNPEDPDSVDKVLRINQKVMDVLRDRYGASCGIYYPGYSGELMLEYMGLLESIKKYLDPYGIMAPGKLVSGDLALPQNKEMEV
jgi:FAD/FMN-containing dehydrogenase